jgi:hypothetical protein
MAKRRRNFAAITTAPPDMNARGAFVLVAALLLGLARGSQAFPSA